MKYSIEASAEVISVSVMSDHVPNPSWKYKDPAGHKHAFDAAGEVPTVRWVVTETYWCPDCRDWHENGEWRCVECEAPVEPNYINKGPTTKQIPGRATYTLTLEDGQKFHVTGEDARRFADPKTGEAAVAVYVAKHDPYDRGRIVFG